MTPRGVTASHFVDWSVSTDVDRDTELALVEGLRRGDERAFDAAYDAYAARLFTFLARLSRRRDLAEDLAEETWLRLVANAARLQGFTPGEAAAICGVTPETLRQRLSRARAQLARTIGEVT